MFGRIMKNFISKSCVACAPDVAKTVPGILGSARILDYFFASVWGAKGLLEVLELFLIYTFFFSQITKILRPIVVQKSNWTFFCCLASPFLSHLLFVKHTVN